MIFRSGPPRSRTKPARLVLNRHHPLARGLSNAWIAETTVSRLRDIVDGNDATPSGTVTLEAAPWGRSMFYDKTSSNVSGYHVTSRPINFAPTERFSIGLTLMLASSSGGPDQVFIGNQGLGGDTKGWTFDWAYYDHIEWYWRVGDSEMIWCYAYYPTFVANVQQRFVLTYDGSCNADNVKFYVNGGLRTDGLGVITNTLNSSSTPYNTSPPQIGRLNGQMNGAIDGLMIWRNRTLTPYEVALDAVDPFAVVREREWVTLISEVSSLTIAPSGIDSTEAFGSGTVTNATESISGTGIDSTVSFGSGTVSLGSQAISGTGIDSTEAFGSGTVSLGSQAISGTGIGSTEAFGSGTVSLGNQTLSVSGLDSTQSLGNSTISLGSQSIMGTGIDPSLGVGDPTCAYAGSQPITGTGIDSTLTFGTDVVTGGAIPVLMTGIDSMETFGSARTYNVILDTALVRRSRPIKCHFSPSNHRTKDLLVALVDYANSEYMVDIVSKNNVTFNSSVLKTVGPYGTLPLFDSSGNGRGNGLKTVNFLYNSPFTISLTAKVADSSGSNRCVVACSNSGSFKGWEWYFTGNTGYFGLYGGSSAYIRVSNSNFLTYTSSVPLRITVTYNGNGLASGFKFYQRGVLLTGNTTVSDTLGTTSTSHTNKLMVGHSDDHLAHYGSVGDILIWNRELSATEVAADYGDPFTPVRPHRFNVGYPYQYSIYLTVTGIGSELSIGSASLSYSGTQQVTGTGIGSTLTFGSAATSFGSIPVLITGIDSTETFGSSSLSSGGQTIVGTGIGSTGSFGTSSVSSGSIPVLMTGIDTTGTFGSSSVSLQSQTISGTGIDSTLTFGTLAIPRQIMGTGISSTVSFGTSVVYLAGTLPVAPTGIDNTIGLGSALVYPIPYLGPLKHFILPAHPRLNLVHPRSNKIVGAWPYYAMKRTYDVVGLNHVDFQNATFGSDANTNLGRIPYSNSTYGSAIRKLDFGPTQPFSIAVTGYIHASAPDVYGAFVSNYYSNSGYSVGLTVTGGSSLNTRGPQFYFGSNSSGARIVTAASKSISKGVAYRYLFTYDGSCDANGVKIYVDGIECTTKSIAQNNLLSTSNTSSAYVPYFNKDGQFGGSTYGSCGNTIIWNRVLSPLEALQDYEDPFGMLRARRPNLTAPHSQNILPAQIESSLAFGSSEITRASIPVLMTGIDSTEAYGTTDVALGILHCVPSGIGSESAFGTPIAMGALAPVGIGVTTSFGTPAIGSGLAVPSIDSTVTIGYDNLTFGNLYVSVSGVSSSTSVGAPTLMSAVSPTSIASTSSVSSPTYVFNTNTAGPSGIDSTLTFGVASLDIMPWLISLSSIESTVQVGNTNVSSFTTIEPSSIQSGETVPIPVAPLEPYGIGSTISISLPHVDQPNNLQPDAIGPTVSFGDTGSHQSGTEYTYPVGIVSSENFGDFSTNVRQSLGVWPFFTWTRVGDLSVRRLKQLYSVSIESTNRFGSVGVVGGLVGIGIDSTLTTGTASVGQFQPISVSGISKLSSVGSPALTATVYVVSPSVEVVGNIGQPSFWRSTSISVTGIASRTTLGNPSVNGFVSVAVVGIEPTSEFGTSNISLGVTTLRVPAIVRTSLVSDPSVTEEPIPISMSGIDSNMGTGIPSLGYLQSVSPSAVIQTTVFGLADVSGSIPVIVGQIDSAFLLGVPSIDLSQTVAVLPILPHASYGTFTVSAFVSLSCAAIESTSSVSSPAVTTGFLSITGVTVPNAAVSGYHSISQQLDILPTGIGTTASVPVPIALFVAIPLAPDGIRSTCDTGEHAVSNRQVSLTTTGIGSASSIGVPSAVEYAQFVKARSIATYGYVPEPYIAYGAPALPPSPIYPESGILGVTRRILIGAWKAQIRISGQHVSVQETDGRGKWWDKPGYVGIPAMVAQSSAKDMSVNDLEQPTYTWNLRFDRYVPLGPMHRVRYTDPTRGDVFIYTGPASDVSGIGVVWSAEGDDTTGSFV